MVTQILAVARRRNTSPPSPRKPISNFNILPKDSMSYSNALRAAALILSGTLVWGQTPQPAPSQPDPAPAPASTLPGNIQVSGLIDAYYSFNGNHPASRFNTLRNFEVKANQFSLNMVKLSLTRAAEPVGFTLDLGAGRAWQIFHATDPAGSNIVQYIPQAYVSVKPKDW